MRDAATGPVVTGPPRPAARGRVLRLGACIALLGVVVVLVPAYASAGISGVKGGSNPVLPPAGWLILGPWMQENFYPLLVGLMLILVAFAFAYHRNAQWTRLREMVLHDVLRDKDQELEFQKLAMDEHSIISIADAKGDIIYVNKKFVEISGYTSDELLGHNHRMVKSNEHSKAFYRDLWQTVTHGRIWTGEVKNRKKDGGFYWVKATIVPFMNSQGVPEKYIAIRTDITERKVAEQQIQQFKTTLDNIEDAVYMFWPGSLKFFYVNQAAQTLDGLCASELIGKTPAVVNPEFTESAFRKRQDGLITGDVKFVTYESYHIRKSGEFVPIEVRLQYMEPKGEAPRFVAFVQDISKRKAAENQIQQFKTTLDNIEDAVYMFWPDNLKFFYVNRAAINLAGLGEEGLLGKTPAILNPDFDLAKFRLRCKPLIFGLKDAIKYETCHLNAKRDLVPFEVQLQIVEPEGEEPRFVVIARDISARREVDRAKSEFVSTVSHELRTPLTSIKGALGLMRAGAAGEMPEKAKKLMKIAADNSDRLVLLINDILDVEKGEAGMISLHLEPIDLSSLVESAIEANQGYAEQYGVHFKLLGDPAPVTIEGDAGRLMQVMANLLSNAAKFSDRGGIVEISLEAMTDVVRLAVRDSGMGIPKEAQASIFEKFTQADSSDNRQKGGTGLGLNIARSIVRGHGGVLDFTSEEGVGTTFFINLKRLPEQTELGRDSVKKVQPTKIYQKLSAQPSAAR